jgi:hypothetical protein
MEATVAELGIVDVVGARLDVAESRRPATRGSILGDKDKRQWRWRMERGEAVALARGEEEAAKRRRVEVSLKVRASPAVWAPQAEIRCYLAADG